MKLKIYRQSFKTRENGITIYKGEDALPVSEDGLIIIADGLGGKASIRHKELSKEIFEEDLVVDKLFKGVYSKYDNELFVSYVKSSFADLFSIKECYFDNIYNIKKSGYFGSRIVAAIVMHEFLYNESIKNGSFFNELSAINDETVKKEKEESIGTELAEAIKEKLIKIAQNVQLKNESSYEGMALLGTTLTVMILAEDSDFVNIIHLTAGDSRAYIWTSEGLMQLSEDQEGADGGMTNSISANEDFQIKCGSIKVDKPCIIFGATDGCFDSERFHSPLCFEKLLMDSINESESVEEMKIYLENTFAEIGTHDDSSTLALQTFGYIDFGALKKEAQNRLKTIKKEYVDKQPDILATDYIRESELKLDDFKNRLSETKNRFFEESFVKDYCENYLKENQIKFYVDSMNAINQKIDLLNKEIEDKTSIIKSIIMRNFIKFKNYLDRINQAEESDNYNIQHEEMIKKVKSEFDDKLTSVKEQFDNSAEKIQDILSTIDEIGAPRSIDDYEEVEAIILKDCENQIDEVFKFFKNIKSGKDKNIKKIISERNLWEQKNIKTAKRSTSTVDKMYNMLIADEINILYLNLFASERETLEELIESLNNYLKEIGRIKIVETKKALEESVQKLWNQDYAKIIQEIVALPQTNIHSQLLEEARTIVGEYKESMEALEENCLLQIRLFDKYNITYLKHINGEAK